MSMNDDVKAGLVFPCPSQEEAVEALAQRQSLLVRDTPRHVVTIIPLTFGRARITVARGGGDYLTYDDSW
jgi:hypothetical protein